METYTVPMDYTVFLTNGEIRTFKGYPAEGFALEGEQRFVSWHTSVGGLVAIDRNCIQSLVVSPIQEDGLEIKIMP